MTLKEELLLMKEEIQNYEISSEKLEEIFSKIILIIKNKIKIGVFIIDLPLDTFLLTLKSEITSYNYDNKLFQIYKYVINKLKQEDIDFDDLSSFKDGKLKYCNIRIKI